MSEIVLKINDGIGNPFRDGDPISAWSRRRIRKFWAETICWPRRNGRRVGGRLGNSEPMLESFLAATEGYRWDRVSRSQVRRTNLRTLDELVYGSKPVADPDANGQMIHCHVEEFVERAVAAGKYPFFGPQGSERFYMGGSLSIDYSNAAMDVVWNAVETMSPHREINYQRVRAGNRSKRVHLYVRTEDFDDETAELITEQETEVDNATGEVSVITNRTKTVDWRTMLGLTGQQITDVLNRSKVVDLRDTQHIRSLLVRSKTLVERGR